jgi:formylglycine-generating enzyme required for sulfatase activity
MDSHAPICERSCPAGHHRVLRGASWNNNERVNLRSSCRVNGDPRYSSGHIGFRVVLVVAGG